MGLRLIPVAPQQVGAVRRAGRKPAMQALVGALAMRIGQTQLSGGQHTTLFNRRFRPMARKREVDDGVAEVAGQRPPGEITAVSTPAEAAIGVACQVDHSIIMARLFCKRKSSGLSATACFAKP